MSTTGIHELEEIRFDWATPISPTTPELGTRCAATGTCDSPKKDPGTSSKYTFQIPYTCDMKKANLIRNRLGILRSKSIK